MVDKRRLLEQEQHLTLLNHAMACAKAGQGGMVLLGGEAGVGKTTLVPGFVESLEEIRVLVGTSDPLPTPLALAPVLDIAPGSAPSSASCWTAPRSGGELFGPVLSHLAALPDPALLVIEDMPWRTGPPWTSSPALAAGSPGLGLFCLSLPHEQHAQVVGRNRVASIVLRVGVLRVGRPAIPGFGVFRLPLLLEQRAQVVWPRERRPRWPVGDTKPRLFRFACPSSSTPRL